MRKSKQLFRHDPPYSIGDCHRTAIACLLDLLPEEVPHFGADTWEDPEAFNAAVDSWLVTRGLATVSVPYGDTLENVMLTLKHTNPDVYCLLGGRSRTGVNHTVVCCGGEMEWDPSTNDSGIVGPCDDGYYWVTWLVPSFMRRKP